MSAAPSAETVLDLRDVRAYYGAVAALHGVDLRVGAGELVVVLGANGAGKTTLLRAIVQLVRTQGTVEVLGADVAGRDTSDVVRRGVALVPEGRGTLTDLSVEDNLRAGAFVRRDADVAADVGHWFEQFPALGRRRALPAGSLSGGEQQMLAIARALMSRPRLLLLDEPSLGLSPLLVEELFPVLARVNKEEGVTVLVVEQNAALALEIADRGYVLEGGRVAMEAPAAELTDNPDVHRAYLGY